jgi:AcrR family transcriptional regulator
MAKAINHKERKRDIRAMSLKLFAQHGFAAVNFGMIAKECGIARTLLYTYFKDKRTIFNEAVDEATSSIADLYRELMRTKQSADAKLRQLCMAVLALLHDNRDFLCVIVDLLREYQRKGKLKVENIMRHTLGMKRIIHSLILEGKHRGEYSPAVNVNRATSLIYSQFEAAILRITVSGGAELTDSVSALNAILLALSVPATKAER